MHRLTLLLVALLLTPAAPASDAEAEAIRIGVLAYDGDAQTLARWRPLAAHLSARMPGIRFRIVPLTHEGFRRQIRKGRLDFALTNPAHSVQLEVDFGATRLLTLRNRHGERALTRFGAVLFTRADGGIEQAEQLAGRRLAAVSPEAFGGFLLARQRLREAAGFDPLHATRPLWLGFPQHEIVQAVLDGRADAGVVRTGVIETMIERGELAPDALRVLLARSETGFPLRLSTRLYPEWALLRLPGTDEALARAVTLHLLRLRRDDPAARAAHIAGWTIPLDYGGVHRILRAFGIAPYRPRPPSLRALWREHGPLLTLAAVLLLALAGGALHVLRLNRALQRSQRALTRHRDELERLVADRTEALLATNRELRADIAERQRQEETLHDSGECLQALQALIARDDLDPDQRLQSILDHLSAWLGLRRLLLFRYHEGRLAYRAASPPDTPPFPICTEALDEAVDRRRPTRRPHQTPEGRMRHLALPVVREGRVRCVLELLADPGRDHRLEQDGLELRLLHLLAHWLACEEAHREQARRRALARHRLSGLTPREREVLVEIAGGATNKEAARRLGISVKTVELHRSNLMRKLELPRLAPLVRLADRAGLLPEEETP